MSTRPIYIYGRNTILELFLHDPERIRRLYVRNTIKTASIVDILYHATRQNIKVERVSENKLMLLVKEVNHQGVIAEIEPFHYQPWDTWAEALDTQELHCVLILDGIEDAHNFGAMIRSATAVGVTAIIVGSHKQAPVNGGVYKTSAGTIGRIPIIQVKNIQTALKRLKDMQFWILGLDARADQSLYEYTIDTSIAFVIGNEGKGIRPKVLEACDVIVSLPLEHNVESLNASVTASVALYEWKRQTQRATMSPQPE